MRFACVPLWIALCVMPACASPSLDEAWARGMRPRSDAAEHLAARIRTSSHRAAVALASTAQQRAVRRRIGTWFAGGFAALVALGLAERWRATRRDREDQRLRSVLDIARRREEERR